MIFFRFIFYLCVCICICPMCSGLGGQRGCQVPCKLPSMSAKKLAQALCESCQFSLTAEHCLQSPQLYLVSCFYLLFFCACVMHVCHTIWRSESNLGGCFQVSKGGKVMQKGGVTVLFLTHRKSLMYLFFCKNYVIHRSSAWLYIAKCCNNNVTHITQSFSHSSFSMIHPIEILSFLGLQRLGFEKNLLSSCVFGTVCRNQ